jgi:hypothetical protein
MRVPDHVILVFFEVLHPVCPCSQRPGFSRADGYGSNSQIKDATQVLTTTTLNPEP